MDFDVKRPLQYRCIRKAMAKIDFANEPFAFGPFDISEPPETTSLIGSFLFGPRVSTRLVNDICIFVYIFVYMYIFVYICTLHCLI